jgi:hypothetical protein
MKHLIKQTWLDRAVEIGKVHAQCCRDDANWTVDKTAKALNRSIGSVSQDITIHDWCKTHEKQLRRCSSLREAMEFIKGKKREMRIGE